jgi:HEAT repeat protein
VLLAIVEGRLPAEADLVVERLPSLAPEVAEGLLRAVGARAPDRVASAAAALLEHREPRLQVAALQALEAAEGAVPVPRLVRLLQSPARPVRVAAAELLGRRADAQAFQVVADSLTQGKDLGHEEAEAYGRALAQIHPMRASQLFAEWLRPRRGLLKALAGGGGRDDLLRWAAVAGLGVHPAADSPAAIEAVAASADEALRRHCYATLARRRHQGARHG